MSKVIKPNLSLIAKLMQPDRLVTRWQPARDRTGLNWCARPSKKCESPTKASDWSKVSCSREVTVNWNNCSRGENSRSDNSQVKWLRTEQSNGQHPDEIVERRTVEWRTVRCRREKGNERKQAEKVKEKQAKQWYSKYKQDKDC